MSDTGAAEEDASDLDFFISYTDSDRAWAEWVAWQLEDAGYRVLVQAWDFIVGSHWPAGMQRGVAVARRTIALLSPAYLRSVYGQVEWLAAQAADPLGFAGKLIPIRVAECPREGLLGQIVSFDLFDLPEAEARARLAEQLAILRSGRAKPGAPPAFPSAMSGAAPRSEEPTYPGQAGLVARSTDPGVVRGGGAEIGRRAASAGWVGPPELRAARRSLSVLTGYSRL
ncbi:toll/interleukin-1 receptor domain-containing protein [Candidatus Frankia alpina]|uniref:toll/interleukin-1 receptor domain-containing protein n=1 Tax=Candidatus Frankia alpina TaxID=2699483 RepID=UPI0013D79644|nr:toll/interleukin-1 receptor domain-containing protein [Candidatus Frankia alpina]